MTKIYWYLALFGVGLIYYLFTSHRLTYLSAPMDVFDPDQKLKTLRNHVLISIVIGVLVINVLVQNYFTLTYDRMMSVMGLAYWIIAACVLTFILVGEVIQIYLLKTHSFFSVSKAIETDPSILEADYEFKTNELLDESEFWTLIERNREYLQKPIIYRKKISEEISTKKPRWIVQCLHLLIELELELEKNNAISVTNYILRKLEGDYHLMLLDLAICQGRDFYKELIDDMDSFANLKFEPYMLGNITIYSILVEIFSQKTGKLLLSQIETIPPELPELIVDNAILKKEFPKVFDRFR